MAYIGKTPTAAPLTSSDITDGIITSAKIVDGTISSADLASDAVDLQPLKSDITALALREATNETSAAFNLPNQFIDTFSDDTNLGTQTTCDRVSGAIVTIYDTIGSSAWEDQTSDRTGTYTVTSDISVTGGTLSNWVDGSLAFDSDGSWYFSGTRAADEYITLDLGSGNLKVFTGARIYCHSAGAYHGHWKWQGSTDNSSYTDLTDTAFAWQDSSVVEETWSSTTGYRYIRLLCTGNPSGATASNWLPEVSFNTATISTTSSATGTLIQSANTVGSAKTKVGGTMLYKDNAGTATLGTDLIIYFTCDGGSNWTEADSYNAITPVYSTGVKQVRLGETTCTSGTDVRYKAVWANQASGSKETQLHGIGVNY